MWPDAKLSEGSTSRSAIERSRSIDRSSSKPIPSEGPAPATAVAPTPSILPSAAAGKPAAALARGTERALSSGSDVQEGGDGAADGARHGRQPGPGARDVPAARAPGPGGRADGARARGGGRRGREAAP